MTTTLRRFGWRVQVQLHNWSAVSRFVFMLRPRGLLVSALLFPVVAGLALPARPTAAQEIPAGLELGEVRTDNFPRIIVRFGASQADGLPIESIRPGQLKVFENGVLQDQLD